MNKPLAPGRIRWAILCLALAATGVAPATAGAASRVEVIVQMDAGSAPAAGKAAVRAAGGKVTGELPIINGFAAELSSGAAEALADADGVKAVTVDNAVKPQGLSISRLATAYGASVDAPQVWNNPISDKELIEARQLVGSQRSDLMTGAEFSDTAVKARGDLDKFRILHFATHGLVTPPEPGCPVRPALLTSFGPAGQSDGLLTFGEIFELKLDADMVILSACDTAGEADVQATREAGVATGGGSALDGLVRAFIGAGGRSVLASHWTAPDDFDATQRLITGLFSAGPGVPAGQALLSAEQKLMADPQTSHPYYWAGFAVIGDATRPLLSTPGAHALAATSTVAGSR